VSRVLRHATRHDGRAPPKVLDVRQVGNYRSTKLDFVGQHGKGAGCALGVDSGDESGGSMTLVKLMECATNADATELHETAHIYI
jgi:hypothetical protein